MRSILDKGSRTYLVSLRAEIEGVVDERRGDNGEDYWQGALVGVASAEDPLFKELRRVVDPEHAMPGDILSGARSVIVYFLAFRESLGKENGQQRAFAARRWAEAYTSTNGLIESINLHLKTCLEKSGYAAALTPATHNFDEKRLVSRWSHKHLAFIAGLGTFGHHHLLITQAGCCGRLGSLATTLPLPPTARPRGELCLQKAGHPCFACVAKCRYAALHKTHFDRHACYRQCLRNDSHYSDLPLVDVCGKCACEVPCSYQVPAPPASTGRSGR